MSNTLLTDQVVKGIAEITGGTQKDAKAHLDAFKEVVVDTLEAGGNVKLKGFVDFLSKEVEAYEARNPQNGEPVQVEAHIKATAKLAPVLRKF